VGNQTHFSANAQHPVYPELSGLIRKTTGLQDVLARALEPLADGVVAAFVFGSVASGTEAAHSDVDLMVIGTASFGEVVNAVYEAQAAVGREINPKVMKREEWQAKRSAGQAFLNEVMHKPKLFIMGTADDL
jgi:predicted nucleotidyltransferase